MSIVEILQIIKFFIPIISNKTIIKYIITKGIRIQGTTKINTKINLNQDLIQKIITIFNFKKNSFSIRKDLIDQKQWDKCLQKYFNNHKEK